MKIVDFNTFCSLPNGTVFSYWRPSITLGLYRRGEVIGGNGDPIDFFESSLIAESYNGEPPVVDLVESRWGTFEYDQQFVVYDQADITVIAEGIGVKPDRNGVE